jgi:ABC-type branched-subunit amino acid transport system ATPase component
VMAQGRKVAEGPPAMIRQDPLVLAAYLGTDPEPRADG